MISLYEMIILKPDQAAVVSREWKVGSRLEPVALKSGNFALPISVASDPDYEWVRPALALCPTRIVRSDEFSAYEPEEEQS